MTEELMKLKRKYRRNGSGWLRRGGNHGSDNQGQHGGKRKKNPKAPKYNSETARPLVLLPNGKRRFL